MTETTHYADDKNLEGVYIPKASQFERDMETGDDIMILDRHDNVEFSLGANEHFILDDIDELVKTKEGLKAIKTAVETFLLEQRPRLQVLNSYAHGQNEAIKKGDRRLEKDKADYRIAHNYGGYIADFITSFIISKPVSISYNGSSDDEGTNDLEDVQEIIDYNELDSLNYELAFDASVYGRAFELHYRNKEGQDIIKRVDPTEIFVIRDKSIDKNIIGAIHCPIFNDYIEITLYTAKNIYKFKATKKDLIKLETPSSKPNPYGVVPVVEWHNNRFREGDFETELDQINAYDAAQSDTANYMSDLNDALLVIKGEVPLGKSDLKTMRDMNLLVLQSGYNANGAQTTADAGYIYKQYDVAGTEAYKNRLIESLHLLSGVPKITDEKFNTQSGIAMMYKLFGLKQKKEAKVRFFTKALKSRFRIIENIRKLNGGEKINSQALTFTFHENLPTDVWAEIKAYIEAGGEVSQETLRNNTTFTTHAEEEKRLKQEEGDVLGYSFEEMNVGSQDIATEE